MIHELRCYDVAPGQWERWEEVFSKTIIPVHTSQGVKVAACWRDRENNQFVWIRVFNDEEHRQKASDAVRNTAEFQAARPQFPEMIKVQEVRVLEPTAFSPFQ